MEYFTPDNIQYAMIAFTWIVYITRKIIKWSPTQSDDEILKKFDSAHIWLSGAWESAYKEVEEIAKTTKLTPVQKTFQYMKLLNDAWIKAQGKQIAIPKVVETTAIVLAKGQALTDKLKLLKDEMQYKLFGGPSPTSEAVEEKEKK